MVFMTGADNRPGAGKTAWILVLVIAVIVATGLGISAMRTRALSFDGGLNAQAAVNLLERGRYGTGHQEFQDFDHRLQTGPTVVLPAALSFWLFGVDNDTAQFANLVYFVLFFIVAVLFVNRHGGAASAFLAILLLAQTPELGPLGLGFYGEIPALVFFIGGLLVVDKLEADPPIRAAYGAGLLLGLSILTKIVMLIPVFSVLLVVFFASITRRPIRLRHWTGMAAGLAAPIAVFEAVKLLVLGPAIWVEWWAVMVRRIAGQGLPLGMADTPGVLPKATSHLGILSEMIGVPAWSVLLLVIAPTFLFLLLWRHERVAKASRSLPVSVVALWLAASSYLAWWLLLTPTSRAWPRRVFNGLLLQELLVSIVLFWAIRRLLDSRQGLRFGTRPVGLRLIAGAALAGLLLLNVSALLVLNLPQIEWRTEPYIKRRAIETVAAIMRTRATDAVFYGKGWYRAPVLALLSGRELKDFNEFPVSRYGEDLKHTYFVVDNHFRRFKPKEFREIIKSTENSLVVHKGDCSLYRLERVLPYPQMPTPDGSGDLSARYVPREQDYPYVGGLGRIAPNGRFAKSVSGFLLERGGHDCLEIELWVASNAGRRLDFEVRVDGRQLVFDKLVPGQTWKQTVILGEDADPGSPGSLVELWLHGRTPRARFSLWSLDKDRYVVREVGFVDCSDTQGRR